MAAINLDIGGNTRRLDRDIQKTVNRVYTINLKTKGDQPLGRITGQVNEFNKSLDASNARVIAFGASAGIIFGVQRAFSALVGATIEVQKSLQDINVILNVSAQSLQKFGGELFNIAKNTGQSFQEVAKAATEFSRQGLGLEETLKRTNEALILSRLSGLDAAKSVEALTAAVNSYASQAVTASEVVNKFANVDAAFAVSSADLADALQRVGSSAAQSGVSLNELIAIVTSAQQTTARGGAVIGNSFKTIFTRLQRGKVVDLLESLGISSTDSSGQLKSTIQLLQDLGKVYDTLGARQQASVAEQVGGVFQINILKAALADLGKEYSIYSSALNVAAGSTDQAIRRNEELNKTYAAQINALQENARQLAATAGERLLGPSIDRLVGGTNTLLNGFSEGDGQDIGSVLGKGILDGIGQFISGPGLALIGGVLLKLFRDLGKFATGSVQQLLGLNTSASQQRDLQASISQILAKNPQLLELALKGEQGLNTAASSLLANLQKQTVELQKQATVAQQISKAFIAQAGVRVTGGIPVVPAGKTPKTKSGGFIPNFSVQSELKGIKKSPDYTASQKRKASGDIRTANIPGIGPTVYNGQESIADSGKVAMAMGYPAGTKPKNPAEKYSILTPAMQDNLGFAAKGFIPNFSNNKTTFKGGVIKPRPSQSSQVADGGLDRYTNFSLTNDVISSRSGLVNKFQKELNLLNDKDPFVAGRAARFFERNGLKSSEVNQLKANIAYRNNAQKFGETLKDVPSLSANTPDKLVNINRQLSSVQNNVLGKSLFEKLSARKLGLVQNPNKSGRLDLLSKEGKPVSEVKFGAIRDDNIVSKIIETHFGKQYLNEVPQEIKMPSEYRLGIPGKASGFIPNFAKIIDLGDTVTAPQLTGKVSSLIHPKVTGGQEKRKVTANYLGQQYQGLVTTAGINQAEIENTVPNLEKNLGRILVDEANQFGQAIGGQNFLKNPDELPNYGAVKGAVGTAFEGGVTTLLQRNLQKSSQTAGIDFTQQRMTAKMKRLFHGAPGTYEAKYSPDLANEVLGKMLRAANVGGVKQAKSGPGYKATQDLRTRARENLEGLGLKRGKQLNAAIEKEMARLNRAQGMAAGYIPNFAAIQAPLQNSINEELASGASPSQIGVGQDSRLKAPFNKEGFGVWSKKYEGSLSQGISMAQKANINPKTKGRKRASGFIPNFAIEDPDIEGASAGTGIAAIVAQLSGVAFAFAFTGDAYKENIEEAIQKNREAGKVTGKFSQAQVKATNDLVKAGKITAEEATKREQAARFGPTGGQKTGAFLKGNSFGLAAAAPILGETIKNVIGQESSGARKTGAVASAAGQIGSFAATGAMIAPGPIGAGVGAAVGALLAIPTLVDEFTTSLPELTMAAKKASQDLTKFGDSGQRLLVASSDLSRLLTEGGSQEAISKSQDIYAKALSELSEADRQRLSAAAKVGKLEEEYAKVLEEKVAVAKGTEKFVKLQEIEEKKTYGIFAGGFDTNSKTRQGRANAETVGGSFQDLFTSPSALPQDLKEQVKAGKLTEQEAVQQNFQKGKDVGLEDLKSLQSRVQSAGAFDPLFTGSGSLQDELKKTLQKNLPESETKSEDIDTLLSIADDDLEGFSNLLAILIKTLDEGPEVLKKSLEAAKLDAEANKARTEALKKSSEAINATISTIQKNIAVQNLLARTLDVTSESFRSIGADTSIAREFTQPAQALESVIGTDKAPARALRAQSDVAIVEESLRSGMAGAGIELKDTIRGIFQKPFEDKRAELTNQLSQTNMKGTPEEIERKTSELRAQFQPLAEQNDKAGQNLEKYLSQFVSGQMSQEQLLNQLNNEMKGVGIDVNKGTQASNEVELAIASFNAKSIQEEVKAFQQRAKLASETKQAILQSRIEQALGTFGGFEGFMNRPEEEQNYIQKITPDLGKIEKTRGSAAFRNTNKESIEEQEKQAPELGRALTNVYKELIDQSGGGFRDFLQKEVDTISNVTGSEDRSGLAGAGGGGGVKDIIRGREVDLKNQLKLAEDKLKITTDPLTKRTLEGFVNSIKSAPGGLKGIATLQTQKELGVANQGDFAKLYGKYENEALNRLKDISPELAASLENAISLSDDPLVAAAELQSSLQGEMVGYLGPIQAAILQIANLGGGSVTDTGVSPTQIEAYKPKLTEEEQKKADEIRTAQEKTAKKEADIKAKKAQEAALPKDNRTTSEIEAATRAKRDQKYLQSPVAPRNRATGEKFGSIEEIDAEMNKALALGAVNPEQKEYYGVLQNFKKNLDPTATTFGRQYDYDLDEKNRPVDPNSPLEIEKRTAAARDQRMRGITNPQQILGQNLSLGPNIPTGEIDLQSQIQSQLKPLGDIGTNLRPLSQINNDVTRADYDMDVKRKGLYEGDFGNRVQQKKLAENPLLTLSPQKITTQGPQPIEQSFTQQEAAFSNNTSALTTLADGIATLNSTISNLNNAPDSPSAAGTQQSVTQPNVTTTTTAPISVIVNPQGGPDIASAIGKEITTRIPEIVKKVQIAMGLKVPPTV